MKRGTKRHTRGAAAAFGIRRSSNVLLILDMISDFDFPDGPAVLRAARRIVPHIAALKARAMRAGVPTIYVNDNFGRWRSDAPGIVRRCLDPEAAGHGVVRAIEPSEEDYIVLKPRHSGFYATPLAGLIEEAQAERVILAGVSSHQCVLFTANDAYLRELSLAVPRDCIAAPTAGETRFALHYFESVLGADTRAARAIRFK